MPDRLTKLRKKPIGSLGILFKWTFIKYMCFEAHNWVKFYNENLLERDDRYLDSRCGSLVILLDCCSCLHFWFVAFVHVAENDDVSIIIVTRSLCDDAHSVLSSFWFVWCLKTETSTMLPNEFHYIIMSHM